MSGLRKFLSVEKTLLQPSSSVTTENDSLGPSSPEYSTYVTARSSSPDPNLPRLPHMDNHTFHGIEKQFEELHDQFRTSSSRHASFSRPRYLDSLKSVARSRRHVDIAEAIFSSPRYRIANPFVSTSVYNEEIADRNMGSHRQRQKPAFSSRYKNVISAIYQEDVADRNILFNGGRLPSPSKISSECESMRYNTGYGASISSPIDGNKDRRERNGSCRTEERSNLRAVLSEENLKKLPQSSRNSVIRDFQEDQAEQNHPSNLRQRSSAPSLPRYGAVNGERKSSPAVQPTLCTCAERNPYKATNRDNEAREPASNDNVSRRPSRQDKRNSRPRTEGILNSSRPSIAPRSSSRKNIHDLSINTQLASQNPSRQYVKVSKVPDLPAPTPKTREPSASIAEIVNSPVSLKTPGLVSPMPATVSTYNVDEIMSMFKQAYISSHATSPHPTFETLQEAIVREINSHDAFHKINSGTASPESSGISADPVESDHAQDVPEILHKKPSEKGIKEMSKLNRKLSAGRRRRNTDTLPPSGRELSFPALKGFEGLNHSSNIQQATRRRRHTYTQPLSPNSMMDAYEDRNSDMKPGTMSPLPIESVAKYLEVPHPSVRPHSSHTLLSRSGYKLPERTEPSNYSTCRDKHRHNNPSSDIDTRKYNHTSKTPEITIDAFAEKPSTVTREEDFLSPAQAGPRTISHAPRARSADANKRRYHTSHFPINKNRVPIRRSSLYKDLFDSGRFAP